MKPKNWYKTIEIPYNKKKEEELPTFIKTDDPILGLRKLITNET